MPTQFSSQVPQVEISGDGFIPNSPNHPNPIESMYAICGNIYHQYTPNVSIYTIHGSYGNFQCPDFLLKLQRG